MKTLPLGAPASSPASPWRSRGYIPHFDQPDLIQSITFRLCDAVSDALIAQWKNELAWAEKTPANDPRQIVLRSRIEKYEDIGYGACWLRNKQIASLAECALLHFDGKRYRIIAWCILPNPIHVIIETREGYPLSGLVHSWKSYIAHEANKLLHRSGKFWFREYHDRYIREDDHLTSAIEYVENNPVKAGLASIKEEWRWSSAWNRRHRVDIPWICRRDAGAPRALFNNEAAAEAKLVLGAEAAGDVPGSEPVVQFEKRTDLRIPFPACMKKSVG